jgi:ClpA/ClpB-like protein/helix-turn-helix protein
MTRGQRLAQLAAEATSAPSARASLRALTELRGELDEFERRQIAHALAEGASFAAIGRDLGRSRQAVHRRFRDLKGEDMPLLTAPDVRRVLKYAREEAVRLGADQLGGEHVVLGILRAGDLRAAELLRSAGATLDRARTQVHAAAPDRMMFRRDMDPADLRPLLSAPARATRERGGRRIEVEDVLAGALEDPHGGAARTLRAIGVDPVAIGRRLG